jgi:hypothetical protein
MLANVTIMALEQKDWFEKRQAIIHERDAWPQHRHACLSMFHETCALFPIVWNKAKIFSAGQLKRTQKVSKMGQATGDALTQHKLF